MRNDRSIYRFAIESCVIDYRRATPLIPQKNTKSHESESSIFLLFSSCLIRDSLSELGIVYLLNNNRDLS